MSQIRLVDYLDLADRDTPRLVALELGHLRRTVLRPSQCVRACFGIAQILTEGVLRAFTLGEHPGGRHQPAR